MFRKVDEKPNDYFLSKVKLNWGNKHFPNDRLSNNSITNFLPMVYIRACESKRTCGSRRTHLMEI